MSIVTEVEPIPPKMQTRLVLDNLGQVEFERLTDHVAPQDTAKLPRKELLKILKNLFRENISLTRKRIEILNFRYNKSLPISEHIDRINRNAAEFERANLTDNNLRVLLLLQSFCFSSDNDKLKKIALPIVEKNPNASLKDITAELEAHLSVASGMKTLENPINDIPKPSINVVHIKFKNKPRENAKTPNPPTNGKCERRCGGAHLRAKCSFRDAMCHKCGRKGHIGTVCQSEPKKGENRTKNRSLVTPSLTTVGRRRRIYLSTSIVGKPVRFQYDSGSGITVVGKNQWIRLGSPKLSPNETVEHAGGNEFKILGKFRAAIRVLEREKEINIAVATQDDVNLFGLNAIDGLSLWSVPLEIECRIRSIRPHVLQARAREAGGR